MSFKKTGETKVFKKQERGFTKRTAEEEKPERYTVDDLVKDSDKGIDPYKLQKDSEADKEKE